MKSVKIKNSWLANSDARLDASFHLSEGVNTRRIISKFCPYPITLLKDECRKLFKGNIHKRVYVSSLKNGLEFYTASDLLKVGISNPKYVSIKYSPHLDDLMLYKDWILITRSGTLGKLVFTNRNHEGTIGTDDLVRIIPKEKSILKGVRVSFLSSKDGNGLLTQSGYGGVVQHIEPHHLEQLPIPVFPDSFQRLINEKIVSAINLREGAKELIEKAQKHLKIKADLPNLEPSEYEYFGNQSEGRSLSVFSRNRSEITSTTFNAFNYSKKIERLELRVKQGDYLELFDCLDENKLFSSGSFKRLELHSPKSIKLINQSDIFNIKKEGKMLARRFVREDKLVNYGEVLIAGVGTLAEGETFCRAIFANEELEGQLISGEFIRMKTNAKVPSGYLYAWLSSDYGFRFIRKTHTGTKLCRPIQKLLRKIPVPILEQESMLQIDEQVKKAHSMLSDALNLETQAIDLVEKEIESWQES